MANRVQFTFIAADRFSAPVRAMKARMDGLVGSANKLAAANRKAAAPYKKLGENVRGVGLAMSGVSAAVVAAGAFAVHEAAKFEEMGLQLEVLAGSAEKGRRLLKNLIDLEFDTPIKGDALFQGTRQLLNFGVAAEDVTPLLRKLSDVALGTKGAESFGPLVATLARAKRGVTSREIMQFRNQGLDLTPILSKFGQVKPGTPLVKQWKALQEAAGKGLVTFEDITGVIDKLTGKSGTFFGITDRQQASLNARWDDFKLSISEVARAFGETITGTTNISDALDSMTTRLRGFAERVRDFGKANPGLVKFGLVLAGATIVLGPLLVSLASLVTVISGLATVFGLVFSIGAVLIGAVFTPMGLAIAAVVGAAVLLYKNFDAIKLSFSLLVADLAAGWDRMLGDIRNVKAQFAEFLTTGVTGKALEFLGVIEGGTAKSQASVDLNITAPRGVVQSVKSRTTGDSSGLDLGMNLHEAY